MVDYVEGICMAFCVKNDKDAEKMSKYEGEYGIGRVGNILQ